MRCPQVLSLDSREEKEDVAKSFMAVPGWTSNPTQIINYASCHDNYTLKDKLNVSREDATEQDRIRMNNLAAAIYMTSEGIPLIHAGRGDLANEG